MISHYNQQLSLIREDSFHTNTILVKRLPDLKLCRPNPQVRSFILLKQHLSKLSKHSLGQAHTTKPKANSQVAACAHTWWSTWLGDAGAPSRRFLSPLGKGKGDRAGGSTVKSVASTLSPWASPSLSLSMPSRLRRQNNAKIAGLILAGWMHKTSHHFFWLFRIKKHLRIMLRNDSDLLGTINY